MNKEQYIITKKLIRKCFNINFSIPKGYGVVSFKYSKWYNMKLRLIHVIVEKIKKYSLPIKYGINYDNTDNKVIYFEFEGEQFSFHKPYINCKNFKGEWTDIHRSAYVFNKKNSVIGRKDCSQEYN